MNPLSLVPSLAARILIVLSLLSFGAWYCVHKGEGLESNRRDALDLKRVKQADATFARMLIRGSDAEKRYLETKAVADALQSKLQERIAHEKESDLAVVSCPAQARSGGVSPVGAYGTFRVTNLFVGLWNDSWTAPNSGAKPVQGDPAVVTATERAPSSVGPKDILENQRVNAASCADDRARLDTLNALITKLEAEWDASHRK